jgi:DNA polymerase III delta prime subunit
MQELADQIDFDEGGGTYLFSGNRGTGKTTELMRLAKVLQGLKCEVFYVNMEEYLNLTMSIEITDFLISVVGGLSEKIKERYGDTPSNIDFFSRVAHFLKTNVKLDGITIPVVGAQLKMSLEQDPVFKKKLQEGMRGHVTQLVQDARQFVSEAIGLIRSKTSPDKKIVLIVDSVEKLRGVGDSNDTAKVFKSVETLFSGHTNKLQFQSLHLVYTVPPYLSALVGGLAALYSGGKIFMLPSVHVYECCPTGDKPPEPSTDGLAAMVEIVTRRFPEWQDFFTPAQMQRLAANSGGDLRDFFRLVKLCISQALYQPALPLPDKVLDDAENDLRNDMPLADDDIQWLKKIQQSHKRELTNQDSLPAFARLTESKYILNYRNGNDWFDVHPLLRDIVTASA